MLIIWPRDCGPNITTISSQLPCSLPNVLFVITHICQTNVEFCCGVGWSLEPHLLANHWTVDYIFKLFDIRVLSQAGQFQHERCQKG